MPMLREEIAEKLRKGLCSLAFLKTNGELREIVATTNPTCDPDFAEWDETHSATAGGQHKVTPHDVIRAWSVEDKGWRSFIVDNVVFISTDPDAKFNVHPRFHEENPLANASASVS